MIFAVVALLVGTAAVAAAAERVPAGTRWQPASANTVVLELNESAGQSLSALRRQLNDSPRNDELVTRFVRAALGQYASNGDARLLGYAEGALAPWQNDAAPPPGIWLLRGRLRQTGHEFAAAAKDLDAFLKAHPRNIEAMLLAADSWRRAGDVDAARRHCVGLQLAGRADYARLCAAEIQLTLRQPEAARATASAALALGKGALRGDERAWALAVGADAARAAGDNEAALALYDAAIEAAQKPPLALQLARVDVMLELHMTQRALVRLSELPAADAVVLRLAIAARLEGAPGYEGLREDVQQRFREGDIAGTTALHLRERAMFALDVLDQPVAAVDYALDNWRVQKGWEDAAILERAANAAGDRTAATVVTAWLEQQRSDAS